MNFKAIFSYCLLCILVWSTPSLALPPEIEVDRALQEAAAQMKQTTPDWPRVLETLMRAEALPVPMPRNFDFHMGRALAGSGKHKAATQRFEHYLSKEGAKGKYYDEALAAYTVSEKVAKEQSAKYAIDLSISRGALPATTSA